MVRNACVAAGNSGDLALVAPVVTLLDDEDPVVRGAAVWALGRLDPARAMAERANRAASETDPSVQAEWRLADAPQPV
jgi:epoxyqueuosine reductase